MSRPPKPVRLLKRDIAAPLYRHEPLSPLSRLRLYVASMNIVTLIGNLATDVELREIGPEKKVASFLLAVDRASRDGGADFVNVCAWDRQAELCAEYLDKGRRVAVDGWLKSRSWEEEGKRRTAIEVVARRVEFLGGPRSQEEEEVVGGEVIPFDAPVAG